MANMRSIGTSIEAFAIANNAVPGPTGGFVVVDWVAPDITPIFIRKLPSTDGWGEPIYFWSDGVDYFLISFGADGLPDQPYHSMSRPPQELSGMGKTTAEHCPNRRVAWRSLQMLTHLSHGPFADPL